MLLQWPAFTSSERAPTTNSFLTNSKKSEIDTCTEHDINTVDARTFPTVYGGDSQSLLERELLRSKDRGLFS